MSINKKAFKTNKEKVFKGTAIRNPQSLRKTGEVKDTAGNKEKEDKETDKKLEEAKKKIKEAKKAGKRKKISPFVGK
tara:strand:- start:1890 stop:2120 length:231 start_codon:yes stop_codon:yes gene_type:complete